PFGGRLEWESRIHPVDLPGVKGAVESHLRGEAPTYRATYRVRHRDGSWRWVLDRGRVVTWTPQGEPLRMLGTHSDVSEMRRLQGDASASALALRQGAAIMPVGRWCWDADLDQTEWDDAMYAITGLPSTQTPPGFGELATLLEEPGIG